MFLFKKICWNDYEANLLVLENKIISIITIKIISIRSI